MPPVVAAVLLALFLVSGRARAETGEVAVSFGEDVPLTVAGAALWLALAGLQDQMVLEHCGWCASPGPVDRHVRGALLASDPEAASVGSSVTGFLLLPLFVSVADILSIHVQGRPWIELAEDLLIVAEAFVVNSLVTRVIKLSVRRTRPYVEYGTAPREGGDDLLSFFSGHTSMSASIAASAATLAFLRGSRLAPWIAGFGASLVVATAMLRIAADKHYFSDVLVGLLVGAAVGVAVPWLHVKRSNVAVLPGAGSVTVIF